MNLRSSLKDYGNLWVFPENPIYINHVNNEKKGPWLEGFDIGDDILPKYMGIITSHYKDPYQPTSRMECHKGFEF